MASGKKLKIKDAYRREFSQVATELSADTENGLSNKEAQERLKKFGRNKLRASKKRSLWDLIFSQVNNPVIYLLTAAAILAFSFGDLPEGIAIIVVLLVNSIIGFWMEFQAQKSMDAIRKMDRIEAKVIRGGDRIEIDAEEVVPGDLLLLEAGDLVPADGRLIEATELKLDESPLTGESVPVDKTTEALKEEKQVADRTNIIYKGTAVTAGKGMAIVFGTGMDTEVGNISLLVEEQEQEDTPLTRKLNKLTTNLIWVILAMAAAFFLIGWLAGKELYQLVQTSIAWAIAAIPEGLPIVASIALARGMFRLSKRNVLIKKLSAVETLGETTVIFTDKTGTLTMNRLTVDTFSLPEDKLWKVDWHARELPAIDGEDLDSDENFRQILRIAVLANDAALTTEAEDKDNSEGDQSARPEGKGDPLEVALLDMVNKLNPELFKELKSLERELHDPFDSDSMVMGTVSAENDTYYIAGKGSPDAIFERSDKILVKGKLSEFSVEEKEKWREKNNDLSEDGLRVLAFAYKNTDILPEGEEAEDFLHELIFVGLIGFLDPPRKEVAASMEVCKEAGIKVVMVTGDHPGTAKNVGKQVRLFSEEKEGAVMHGRQLQDEMDNKNHQKLVDTSVFSRVDPEQKLKLIKHFQEQGEIVGMTGDGVNDAPALKKADIGIAMGKRGTQVAQEVSDVVLKDDSFSSIVVAIKQGRIIFGNIRRFVMYQLSYHLGEIILIAFISFTLFILPILPLQLLFLNLLSDVFPALALGVGEGNDQVMKMPPKDPKEPIITKKNWLQIGIYGLIIGGVVTGAYFYGHFVWETSQEINNNIAFFSLAFAQFLHVLNMREAEENLWNNQVTRNKYVWMAVVFCVTVLLVFYNIPLLANVLSFEPLGQREWGLIAVASFLPTVIIQLIKMIKKDF